MLHGYDCELADLSAELSDLSPLLELLSREQQFPADCGFLRQRMRTAALWLLDVLDGSAAATNESDIYTVAH